MEIFGFPTIRSLINRNEPISEGGEFVSAAIASARSAGIRVTNDNASQICAVFACIRARAESLAAITINLYKKDKNGGREIASDHPLSIIFKRPNPWQSWQDYCEMLSWHLDLRGNCFAEIYRTKGGAVTALVPLNPDTTVCKLDEAGEHYYEVNRRNGKTDILDPFDVFHIKIFSNDGLNGVSAITHQKMLMETAMAQEQFSSNMFKNGTALSGILKHPAKFKDKKAQDRVLKSWRDAYSGARNAGKVAILEEGMGWEKISMTAVDAQFTAQMLQSTQRICGVLRVPGHKIGDLSNSKYANIETQNLDFVTDSLVPYGERWQAEIWWKLLSEKERVDYFAEFLYYSLLKGDQKGRNEALKIQREQGIIDTNEWRRIENMNPIEDAEGGKLRIVPINFQSMKFALERPEPAAPAKEPAPAKKESKSVADIAGFEENFLNIFAEQVQATLTKWQNAERSAIKKGAEKSEIRNLRAEQSDFLEKRLAFQVELFCNLRERSCNFETVLRNFSRDLTTEVDIDMVKNEDKQPLSKEFASRLVVSLSS